MLWTAVVVVPGGLLLLPFLVADALKRRAARHEEAEKPAPEPAIAPADRRSAPPAAKATSQRPRVSEPPPPAVS